MGVAVVALIALLSLATFLASIWNSWNQATVAKWRQWNNLERAQYCEKIIESAGSDMPSVMLSVFVNDEIEARNLPDSAGIQDVCFECLELMDKAEQPSSASKTKTVGSWKHWNETRKLAFCDHVVENIRTDLAGGELAVQVEGEINRNNFADSVDLFGLCRDVAEEWEDVPLFVETCEGKSETDMFLVGKRRHLPVAWFTTQGEEVTASLYDGDGKIVERDIVSTRRGKFKEIHHIFLDPGRYYFKGEGTSKWTVMVFRNDEQLQKSIEMGKRIGK